MSRMAAWFLALSTILLISGCWSDVEDPEENPFACTNLGCEDRLDIDMVRRNETAFEPGTYNLTFEPSHQNPIEVACELGGDDPSRCTGETHLARMEIASSDREIRATFDFAPAQIVVEMSLEGELLARDTLAPRYHIVTPNGSDCEPTCFQASETLEVE